MSRNTDTVTSLTVALSSSDPTEATVPATVTIPAGQASVQFNMAAVDDAIDDGTQTVTITASATGFSSGSDTVDVTDNDSPPILDPIGNRTVAELTALTFIVSGTDADLPAQTLIYSATGLPPGRPSIRRRGSSIGRLPKTKGPTATT